MCQPLFTKSIDTPRTPRVVYFSQEGEGQEGAARFVNVASRVVKLEIAAVDGESDGAHWLRRLDIHGKRVWRTRHPSLQETFWHAEWEYQIKEEDWEKVKRPRKAAKSEKEKEDEGKAEAEKD